MQRERKIQSDATGTTLRAMPLLPSRVESKGEKTEEREWCVGRRSCRIVVVWRANVWRRQGDQRCMRLERPEAHAEGLAASCGKGCYFWRLRFPFLLPYASHFLPRTTPLRVSFLSTGTQISPFLRSNDSSRAVHSIFEMISRSLLSSFLFGDRVRRFHFIYEPLWQITVKVNCCLHRLLIQRNF